MNNSSIGEMLTAPLLFGFGNIYAPLKKTDDGIAEPVYIGLNGIYTFKIHNASSFARVFGKKSLASPDFLRKKTVPIINAVSSEVLQNYLKSHEILQSKISESFPSLEAEILNALSKNEKLKAAEVDVYSIKIDGEFANYSFTMDPEGNPVLELCYRLIPVQGLYLVGTLLIYCPVAALIVAVCKAFRKSRGKVREIS